MKHSSHCLRLGLLVCALGLGPTSWAQQAVATVISSTPILATVQTPAQVCVERQIRVEGERSGGGALMGAMAGGALGNTIGEGSGNDWATAIGFIGGAMLGDRIEGPSRSTAQTVRDCHTELRSDTRVRAYRVVYEYAGQRYEIETNQDPGRTLPLNITPAVPLSAAPSAAPLEIEESRRVSRVVVTPPVRATLWLHGHTHPSAFARRGRHDDWRWDDRHGWR